MRLLKNTKPKKLPGDGDLHNLVLSPFDSVRSIQDCLYLFEAKAMYKQGCLSEEAVAELWSICMAMRQKGMALEPNLIGRAVAQSIADPRRAGKIAMQFADKDTDFNKIMADADAMRDNGNFAKGEYYYSCALKLFPMHPTPMVQYAHCLKEQDKLPDALVRYLDSVIFGAPISDVEEHALFVADRLGLKDRVSKRFQNLSKTPPSVDIYALFQLLFGREPSITLVLHLMIDYLDSQSIIVDLIRRDEFRYTNRDLLRLVAETNWSPEHA